MASRRILLFALLISFLEQAFGIFCYHALYTSPSLQRSKWLSWEGSFYLNAQGDGVKDHLLLESAGRSNKRCRGLFREGYKDGKTGYVGLFPFSFSISSLFVSLLGNFLGFGNGKSSSWQIDSGVNSAFCGRGGAWTFWGGKCWTVQPYPLVVFPVFSHASSFRDFL